ncbi:MAG: hypothetical protein QS721_13145 [Candidatus Endonucleobacter sp. (ex Gigantidas childressi)]|nr:hypothetical protein [Candidatus Endonucleobacter sp. (ex Gigantidas childressi)]
MKSNYLLVLPVRVFNKFIPSMEAGIYPLPLKVGGGSRSPRSPTIRKVTGLRSFVAYPRREWKLVYSGNYARILLAPCL